MYDTPEPTIIARVCGGFLAISPKRAAFKIGVAGPTEAVALEKFYSRYAKWRESFLPAPDYQI